jgi:hypothetical protein
MIWKEYFALLADLTESCVYIDRRTYWSPKTMPHALWYSTSGRYGALPGSLELFLVSKQVAREAQEVFWTSTIFKCRLLERLLGFFNMKRHTVGRSPRLYPTHLLRWIKVDFNWIMDSEISVNRLFLVECLWTIARYTDNALDPLVDSYDEHDQPYLHYLGYDTANNTSTFPAMLTQIRDYQTCYREAGRSLRVPKKEMRAWIDGGAVFILNLPPILQRAAAKNNKTSSMKQSSI